MSDIEETHEEDRIEVDVLGRNLGTASGWDGDMGECIWFYDFEPDEGIDLPKGMIQIDYNKGIMGVPDDESGVITDAFDIVVFLSKVEKRK